MRCWILNRATEQSGCVRVQEKQVRPHPDPLPQAPSHDTSPRPSPRGGEGVEEGQSHSQPDGVSPSRGGRGERGRTVNPSGGSVEAGFVEVRPVRKRSRWVSIVVSTVAFVGHCVIFAHRLI